MTREANDWLSAAQAQLLRGDLACAETTLASALLEHPGSIELRRAQAGVLLKSGRMANAESLLRKLLDDHPSDTAAAFALARILQPQGQMAAIAAIFRACFDDVSNRRDSNLIISAIELLDDCGQKTDAAAIAETAIAQHPGDARLHAYAGMLQAQLGQFERAREHYLCALANDERAWEWHVPIGIAATQRYPAIAHPDFVLFEAGLQRSGLSEKARGELNFALGKAHDDIGSFELAAQHFRAANAVAHRQTKWSHKAWRRTVEARLAAQPMTQTLETRADFTPVFIVGMLRSGTTLLAELLSRFPRVCNRGELPGIAKLAALPALSHRPHRAELQRAADHYTALSLQDDAGNAHWFIDKQPLNFRYVDLMLAMFPGAKIVHCQRSQRDNALSLWMQCFREDVQGYSYDFSDIALVMRDGHRLMERWRQRYPDCVRTVNYEQLVAAPQATVDALARWIGLPALPEHATPSTGSPSSIISTASLWQARQPVNSRSVDRWKGYAPYIPELLRFAE